MLKEISYSMTFGAKTNAYTAWNICASLWTESSRLPEDSAPALTANLDGTYTAGGTLRLPADTDIDGIVGQLMELVDNVSAGSAGHISHHDCYHDEGGACVNVQTVSWGDSDE